MYKTILKIDGMMCGMCEAHMNDMIRANFKIDKVTSSAKKGETVVISQEKIDTDVAEKEIENTGYKLLSSSCEPYEKKKLFSFGKK
ncbi:MAG: heavy metal-associated domain-containing protein [Hespellia sp.]|nr:heavy metal-associated domain-containing protein [Hespellia sp.]